MAFLRLQGRLHLYAALGFIICVIALLTVRPRAVLPLYLGGNDHGSKLSPKDPLDSAPLAAFWKEFEQALLQAKPTAKPVVPWRAVSVEEQQLDPDTATRVDYITMDEGDLEALRHSHENIVDSIRTIAPRLPYDRATRGIVMSAGGTYLGVAVISIRMLRRSGSKLPVQVFLDTRDDYDVTLCDHVLPSLNARCTVLADFWSKTQSEISLAKYQYKVFALVFSSFEETIFLDADAFPAHDLDYLLDVEPFLSTGLVTWPDFWLSTSSHYFYEIAGLEVPPLTLRKSSESGIMIYSKRTHASSLLLAIYYNYYGPSHYYPLLSQGAQGQGDKETFLHAALALGEPFYDVRTPVEVLGTWLEDEWFTAGLKQADPSEDWALRHVNQASKSRPGNTVTSNPSIGDDGMATAEGEDGESPQSKYLARPFFIHHNIVKLNVNHLFERPSYWANTETQHYNRLWGPADDTIRSFTYDVERGLWEEVMIAACDVAPAVCDRVKSYIEAVFPEA